MSRIQENNVAPTSIQVLVIENNPTDVLLLQESLAGDYWTTYELTTFTCLSEAIHHLQQNRFDVILLDLALPDSHGLQTFTALYQQFPQIPIIILSGSMDEMMALQAVQAGAQDYLDKAEIGRRVCGRAIRYAIEHHHNQQAIRASEARFATVFRASPLATALTRIRDNRLVEVNDVWLRLTGYQYNEVIGHAPIDLHLWANPEDRQQMIDQIRLHGQLQGFECQLCTKSGQLIYILMSGEMIDLDGEPCLLSMALDIDQRKQTELALERERTFLKTLLQTVPDLIWLKDPDGVYLMCNSRFEKLFGTTEAQLVGRTDDYFVSPEQAEAFRATDQRAIMKGGPFIHEEILTFAADGHEEWVETIKTPMFDTQGHLIGVLGIARDLSEHKQVEAIVRQNAAILAQAGQMAHLGAWEIWLDDLEDLNRNRLKWSDEVYRIFGYKPGTVNVTNDLFFSHVHPDDQPLILAAVSQAIQEKKTYEIEHRIIRLDGTERVVLEHADVAFDDGDRPVRMLGAVQDITEQKAVERELRESEERLRFAIEAANLGVWTYAPETNSLFNLATASTWGGDSSKLNGPLAGVMDMLHPDDVVVVMEALQKALVTGLPYSVEVRFVLPGGVTRYFVTQGRKITRPQGPPQLFGVSLDITERKEADLALRRAEARYRALIENAPDGIVLVSGEGKFKYISPFTSRLLGYEVDELLGTDPTDLTHPDDMPMVLAMFEDILVNPDLVPTKQYRFRHHNGSWHWVESTFSNLLAEPSVEAFVINFRDITERKAAEAEIARLLEIIEMARDMIASLDTTGQLVYLNTCGRELLAIPPDAPVANFHISDFYPPEIAPALLSQALPQAQKTGHWQGETFFRSLNGTEFPVAQTIVAHYAPDGSVANFSTIAQDITERRRMEVTLADERHQLAQRVAERTAQLSYANAALARASRMKDEFLASMSHELRTPLTAILGLSESLQDFVYGTLNQEQLKSLEVIESSGRHLLKLINDILDLSKIGAGKLELEIAPVQVDNLCQSSLQMIKQLASQKRLQVSYTPPSDQDWIQADERRLKQMLVNLLSNAVKFTAEGGWVGLTVTPENDGEAICFAVWDTGIGIRTEDMERLFKPFVQLDSRLSRQYSGTGLGLALVRQLAEMHRGRVGVESEPGKGSRFYFVIPTRQPTGLPTDSNETALSIPQVIEWPATTHILPTAKKDKKQLLIVEDNESNLNILTDNLQAHGYETFAAADGFQALDRLQSFSPDLILMDVQLPGMDGLDTIRTLRRLPEFTSVPIIAITALAMSGDEERCLEAGANAYMSKPLRLAQLRELISYLLAHQQEN